MGRVGTYVIAAAALLAAAGLAASGFGEEPGALSDWQALTLGVVEGVTELLPISSSGHLILVPWLADWTYLRDHEAFNQTFDVALHVGALAAVVAYFRRDVACLLVAWLRSLVRRRVETVDERAAWFVFVATIPAAATGALGESFILEHLGEPWQIAILLAVFSLVLWHADRQPARHTMEELGLRTAALVGVAQCLALAPGVSRSGITISAARYLGLDRESAARFSFLLLIPVAFGAAVWSGVNDILLDDLPPGSLGPFAVGAIAAAGSGFVAIAALLGYLRRHDYSPFVFYRLLASLAVLLLIATGVRSAGF